MLMIFSGISLVQGAFFAFAAYGFMENMKSVALKSGIEKGSDFFEKLRLEETFVYLFILLAILIATLLFVFIGLRVTHQAVGAIYRMKKDIKKMQDEKKISHLSLRKNDYFKDFEKTFNDLVDIIQSK
ncbi:MAG: hypothetical protein AAF203_06820 [Pseudomonadota bacterium]